MPWPSPLSFNRKLPRFVSNDAIYFGATSTGHMGHMRPAQPLTLGLDPILGPARTLHCARSRIGVFDRIEFGISLLSVERTGVESNS